MLVENITLRDSVEIYAAPDARLFTGTYVHFAVMAPSHFFSAAKKSRWWTSSPARVFAGLRPPLSHTLLKASLANQAPAAVPCPATMDL
jgi:hypothetical protein